jgi:hypothetical protein
VALTRARRYCAVALPKTTPKDLLDAYAQAGFAILGLLGSVVSPPAGRSAPAPATLARLLVGQLLR